MSSQASVLIDNFTVISGIVESFAILAGLCLLFTGFLKLKRYGEMRTMMSTQMSIMTPMMSIVTGTALLIFPSFLKLVLLTFWGNWSPLAYHGGGGSGYEELMVPILMFVRIIGAIAVIRGLILLSRFGGQQSQPGSLGKALLHIFGGVLALHVNGTVQLLKTIFDLA